MSWDLNTARARVGLPFDDNAQDTELTAAMSLALTMAESYCDRRFLHQADAETFRAPFGPTLLVHRYPLRELVSVEAYPPPAVPPVAPVAVPAGWSFDARRGIVYTFGGWPGVTPVGSIPAPLGMGGGITLNYVGGYEELPADLEAALWFAFDAVWLATPGWGSQGGTSAPVRSFSIDGMTINYEVGQSEARAPAAWGLLPASSVSLLHFYRAESAALGA